jgi:hypothetical protein
MLKRSLFLLFPAILLILISFSCVKKVGKLPVVVAPVAGVCDSATYTLKIKNILDANCGTAGCHSGANPQNGIDFTKYSDAVTYAARIKARAIDGNPAIMPASGKLAADKIALLQCWLDKGTPQ